MIGMAALSSKIAVSLVMSARLLTSFNQAVYSSLSGAWPSGLARRPSIQRH